LRNFFTLLSKKYKHIWDYPCDMKEWGQRYLWLSLGHQARPQDSN
jgi:hypothetical protein